MKCTLARVGSTAITTAGYHWPLVSRADTTSLTLKPVSGTSSSALRFSGLICLQTVSLPARCAGASLCGAVSGRRCRARGFPADRRSWVGGLAARHRRLHSSVDHSAVNEARMLDICSAAGAVAGGARRPVPREGVAATGVRRLNVLSARDAPAVGRVHIRHCMRLSANIDSGISSGDILRDTKFKTHAWPRARHPVRSNPCAAVEKTL